MPPTPSLFFLLSWGVVLHALVSLGIPFLMIKGKLIRATYACMGTLYIFRSDLIHVGFNYQYAHYEKSESKPNSL
jgi:hypothetical protein